MMHSEDKETFLDASEKQELVRKKVHSVIFVIFKICSFIAMIVTVLTAGVLLLASSLSKNTLIVFEVTIGGWLISFISYCVSSFNRYHSCCCRVEEFV